MKTIAKNIKTILVNSELIEITNELTQSEDGQFSINEELFFWDESEAINKYFEINIENQNKSIVTIKDLEFLISTYKIKITPAQKKILAYLSQGYKLAIINSHRMNGGELMWKSPNSNNLEYAGSVYKAFNGLSYSIQKSIKLDINIWTDFSVKIS